MLGSVAVLGPLVVALWVFSVGDVLAAPRGSEHRRWRRRWLLLTSLVPLVGSVAWIVSGRPAARSGRGYGRDRQDTVITDDDIRELLTTIGPEDPDAFRRRCRERVQEQRIRYAAQRRASRPVQDTNGVTGAAE